MQIRSSAVLRSVGPGAHPAQVRNIRQPFGHLGVESGCDAAEAPLHSLLALASPLIAGSLRPAGANFALNPTGYAVVERGLPDRDGVLLAAVDAYPPFAAVRGTVQTVRHRRLCPAS